MKVSSFFGRIADRAARATGHPITFISCCLVIVIWALSGPFFRFSEHLAAGYQYKATRHILFPAEQEGLHGDAPIHD